MSDPSNMANFTTNSYNLENPGNSWCVKKKSIYTNPSADFNYFNKKCGDPYTYYAYWYRRYPNQNSYLNCYYLPYKSYYLHNKWGYVNGSKKNCSKPYINYHFNGISNGFKIYDTRINPSSERNPLSFV
jgi:hypothetical protein